MRLFNRIRRSHGHSSSTDTSTNDTSADVEKHAAEQGVVDTPLHWMTMRVFAMGVIVSLGGMIFGYDTGQISGFLEMPNFLTLFADRKDGNGNPSFSNTRSGTIVALVCSDFCVGSARYSHATAFYRDTRRRNCCCSDRG
jgi:MFS transporter, SP family, sugar:H+ symporter